MPKTTCSSCLRDLKHSDALVGKTAKCPHCGNRVNLTGSASSPAKVAVVQPAARLGQPSPLEQVRATAGATAPPAFDGLYVCGAGPAPDVLLLTPTHLLFGSVRREDFPRLRQQLRAGTGDSSIMKHPSWTVALKDLKQIETRAGDGRGHYAKFLSTAPNGQQEKLIAFDQRTDGSAFLDQLRAQLGDGWVEKLCRDWFDFRRDLGAGLGLGAGATLIYVIAMLAADDRFWEDMPERVGILKLILALILWVIGSLLGPIGTTLVWLVILGWVFYALIYSGWRDSLSILRIAPRKS
ncbi:MAG: hypothetical protein R3B90_16675 [Planctomycetaceae bacterium]